MQHISLSFFRRVPFYLLFISGSKPRFAHTLSFRQNVPVMDANGSDGKEGDWEAEPHFAHWPFGGGADLVPLLL